MILIIKIRNQILGLILGNLENMNLSLKDYGKVRIHEMHILDKAPKKFPNLSVR